MQQQQPQQYLDQNGQMYTLGQNGEPVYQQQQQPQMQQQQQYLDQNGKLYVLGQNGEPIYLQ
jgi:uncharacterized pyridoxamine 5'-phosphate oxidase family protein